MTVCNKLTSNNEEIISKIHTVIYIYHMPLKCRNLACTQSRNNAIRSSQIMLSMPDGVVILFFGFCFLICSRVGINS